MAGQMESGGDFLLKLYSKIVDTAEHKGMVEIDREQLGWQLLNTDADNLPAFITSLVDFRGTAAIVSQEMTPRNGALLAQAILAIYDGMAKGTGGLNSRNGFMVNKVMTPGQKVEYKNLGGEMDPGFMQKLMGRHAGGDQN